MRPPDRLVDALGTYCPVPLALTGAAAEQLPSGAVIELLADDPLIEVDLPAWCHDHGHALQSIAREGADYRARLTCGPA